MYVINFEIYAVFMTLFIRLLYFSFNLMSTVMFVNYLIGPVCSLLH